jgi:hypothetical protein
MSGKDLEPVGGGHHLKHTAVCITLHPLSPPACRQVVRQLFQKGSSYSKMQSCYSVLPHTSMAIVCLLNRSGMLCYVTATIQQSILSAAVLQSAEMQLLCYHTCEQGLEADTQA